MNDKTKNAQAHNAQSLDYQFQGRHVEIRPDAQAKASGFLKDAIFIDGRPLAVSREIDGYRSAVHFYRTYPTLRDIANAAVIALGGRQLPPLQDWRTGRLPEGLPDLDDPSLEPRIRKNLLQMSATERLRFVQAVLTLRNTSSFYDDMVKVHMDTMTPEGHMWSAHQNALLPWHRIYLYHFESLLRAQQGFEDVTLPYWDWTNTIRKGVLPFSEDFLGGGGVEFFEEGDFLTSYKVMDGPFAYDKGQWTIVPDGIGGKNYLTRRNEETLFDITIIEREERERVLNINRYAAPDNQGFNYQLNRNLHDPVHNEVGGAMGSTGSPNDPVFWMHHCMLDKVWADWQHRYPDAEPYENTPGYHPDFDMERTLLEPWKSDLDRNITIKDLLNYRKLYIYE